MVELECEWDENLFILTSQVGHKKPKEYLFGKRRDFQGRDDFFKKICYKVNFTIIFMKLK